MGQLVIAHIDDSVLQRLKARAVAHGRTVEAEAATILEQHARMSLEEFRAAAERIRKSLEQTGRQFSDSAELIREDRER